MIGVSVANPFEYPDMPYTQLKEVAKGLLESEGIKEAKISLAFVDDATSARINKQFLDHEGPTDVITFPLSNKGAKKLEGELVIGMDVAIREAKERGHQTTEEMCLYVIHGLLHLCGFDDKSKKDVVEMRKKEREYLKKFNLPPISEL